MLLVKNLKKIREDRGLTQGQLGKLVTRTQQDIRRYESGEVTPPLDVLIKIVEVLGTSLDHVVGLTDKDDDRIIIDGAPLTGKELCHLHEYRKLSSKLQKRYDAILDDYGKIVE